MALDDDRGVPSTAAIAGHPVHHLLIPFPIAFLVGALATDIVWAATGAPFWAIASMWLVGAGLVMGALAALAGLTDFFTIERARQHGEGWVHFLGNGVVMLIALASLLYRIGDPQGAASPVGLILSAITVAILLVTGWTGGELAYRYKIGVMEGERQRAAEPVAPPLAADLRYAGEKPDSLKR